MAGFGQLLEVRFRWTIDDLLDAHEVLDIKEEAEAAMMKSRDK